MPKADWGQLDLPGVSVLEAQRHHRKLRRGANKGNKFQLRIRELVDPGETLPEKLAHIAATGVPNYFGEQRFGRNGNNIGMAHQVFARRRLPREQRSIAISAARSLLFNDVLSSRVQSGDWNRLLDGDVANMLMAEMAFLDQEHLRVLLLNTKNQVLGISEVYKGNVNSSVIRAGEVFQEAVRSNCPSVIVVHNHPSGDPTPSQEDVQVTRQLVEAGRLLDIELLDHVVIGRQDFVSLKEKGLGFG